MKIFLFLKKRMSAVFFSIKSRSYTSIRDKNTSLICYRFLAIRANGVPCLISFFSNFGNGPVPIWRHGEMSHRLYVFRVTPYENCGWVITTYIIRIISPVFQRCILLSGIDRGNSCEMARQTYTAKDSVRDIPDGSPARCVSLCKAPQIPTLRT
jgi:hypothetical protein